MEKVKTKITRTKRFIWTMSFCIKLAQVVLLGLIPSALSVLLLFINPNERVWAVASGLAYIIFLGGNCFFCYDFMIKKRDILQYYVINAVVFFLYACVAWFLPNHSSAMEYSWFFSNMRFFESLTVFIPRLMIKTRYSILISNALMMAGVVITERLSHIKIKKMIIEEEASKPLEAETDENVVIDDSAPTQNAEEIRILSIEEMEKEMQQDAFESKNVIESKMQGEKNADILDGGEMTQGRGKKVERIDYSKLSQEELLTDTVKQEDSSLDAYDSDSLWNIDLKNDMADFTDTAEETENNQMPEEENEPEDLWNPEALKGRGRLKKSQLKEEAAEFNISSDNDNYDSSSLWSEDFYQANKKRLGNDDDDENEYYKEYEDLE